MVYQCQYQYQHQYQCSNRQRRAICACMRATHAHIMAATDLPIDDDSVVVSPSTPWRRSSARHDDEVVALRILKTFRFMTLRRLKRRYGGTIQDRGSRAFVMLLAFILQALGWTSISYVQVDGNSTDPEEHLTVELNLSVIDNVGLLLLSFALVFVVLQVAEMVRNIIHWLVLGLVSFIVLQIGCARTHPVFDSGLCDARVQIVTFATLGGMSLSVAVWLATNQLYPYLLRRGVAFGRLDVLPWWWSIVPIGPHRPTAFAYRPSLMWPLIPGWRWLLARLNVPLRHFGYDGELDDEGRPHGIGTWNDSATHGESLHGVWCHGEPIGPFRATHTAHGYTFKSVRVAYAHNRAEPLDEYWFRPALPPQGMLWGVCSVEWGTGATHSAPLPVLQRTTPGAALCVCAAGARSPARSSSTCRRSRASWGRPPAAALRGASSTSFSSKTST